MKPVSTARKVFDWVLGITLLLLGVAGWILPILQGWVFILAGLAVLSSHSKWARAILDRLKSTGRKVRDKIRERRAQSRSRRSARRTTTTVDDRD